MTTDPHHSPQGSRQNGSASSAFMDLVVHMMIYVVALIVWLSLGTCTPNTTSDPRGASRPLTEDHRGTNRNDYLSTATTDRIKEEKR